MVLKLIIIRLFQVVHMLLVYNKNIFKNDRNSRGNELWNQSLFNSMAMLSSISQLFLTVPRFSGCICFSVHQYCKGALNITLPLPSTLFLTCSERDHYWVKDQCFFWSCYFTQRIKKTRFSCKKPSTWLGHCNLKNLQLKNKGWTYQVKVLHKMGKLRERDRERGRGTVFCNNKKKEKEKQNSCVQALLFCSNMCKLYCSVQIRFPYTNPTLPFGLPLSFHHIQSNIHTDFYKTKWRRRKNKRKK